MRDVFAPNNCRIAREAAGCRFKKPSKFGFRVRDADCAKAARWDRFAARADPNAQAEAAEAPIRGMAAGAAYSAQTCSLRFPAFCVGSVAERTGAPRPPLRRVGTYRRQT